MFYYAIMAARQNNAVQYAHIHAIHPLKLTKKSKQ